MPLYEHQKKTLAFMYTRYTQYQYGAILALSMGLGKTLCSLVMFRHMLKEGIASSVLIVIPPTLYPDWVKEIKKVFKEEPVIYRSGRKARPIGLINLVSYDMLKNKQVQEQLNKLDKYILICDEAHKYISKTTNGRYKAVSTLKPVTTFLLTGTPIYNRLENLYGLVSLVAPDLAGTKKQWQDNYLVLKDRWLKRKPFRYAPDCKCPYGKKIPQGHTYFKCGECGQNYVKDTYVAGYRQENLGALKKKLSTVLIRIKTEECNDLPEKRVHYVPYQLKDTKLKYEAALANMESSSQIHELLRILSGSTIV